MSKALKRDLPIIISVVCHDSRLALGRKVIVFSFFAFASLFDQNRSTHKSVFKERGIFYLVHLRNYCMTCNGYELAIKKSTISKEKD